MYQLCLVQVVMDTSEVGLVASQIVTSLGADWDQSGFEELIGNANGFQFGTFLTLLEKRYLADVDRAGLVEALNAVTNTFIDDIIKKVRIGLLHKYAWSTAGICTRN